MKSYKQRSLTPPHEIGKDLKDNTVDSWLQNKVGPAYDAIKNNPERGISLKELKAKYMQPYKT